MSSLEVSKFHVDIPAGPITVHRHRDLGELSLVLVHGSFGQSRLWDHVVAELPERVTAYALDLPGHGDSAWRESYPMESVVETIAAVVGVVPGPVVLAGHSLGAAASMAAAAQLGDALIGAAFLDIDPLPPPSQAEHLNAVVARPARIFATFADLVARESRMAPGASPEVHRQMAEHGYRACEGGWIQRFDQRFLADIRPWDMRPWLPMIRVPALVLRGANSTVMSPRGYDDMLSGLANGRGVLIPGASHQLHLERPAEVAAELNRFIESL